ncbi:MAG: hypothetical protein K6E84_00450 [Lachnospiraceae bacterium]|nr:hypothetical protein [Lachnospiraceae bacterium]
MKEQEQNGGNFFEIKEETIKDKMIREVQTSASPVRAQAARFFLDGRYEEASEQDRREKVGEYLSLKTVEIRNNLNLDNEAYEKVITDLDKPQVEDVLNSLLENVQSGPDMLLALNLKEIDTVLYPTLDERINMSYNEGADDLTRTFRNDLIERIESIDDDSEDMTFENLFLRNDGVEFVPDEYDVEGNRLDGKKEFVFDEDAYVNGPIEQTYEEAYQEQKDAFEREQILNDIDDDDELDVDVPNLNDLIGDYEGPTTFTLSNDEAAQKQADIQNEEQEDIKNEEQVNIQEEKPIEVDPEVERILEEDRAKLQVSKQKSALTKLMILHTPNDKESFNSSRINNRILNKIVNEMSRLDQEGADPKYEELVDKDDEALKELDPWKNYSLEDLEREEKQEAEQKQKEQEEQYKAFVEAREREKENEDVIINKQTGNAQVMYTNKNLSDSAERENEEPKQEIPQEDLEMENLKIEEAAKEGNIFHQEEKKEEKVVEAPKAETPEEFIMNGNKFLYCGKSRRVAALKEYLVQRAMDRYTDFYGTGYENREESFMKYLSTNEVAMQLIDDMARSLNGPQCMQILKSDKIMKVGFDAFEKNLEVSDRKRAKNVSKFYTGPDEISNNLRDKAKSRFFGSILNPSPTVERMQEECYRKLDEAKERPFKINHDNMTKAADLIFAEMLTRNQATMAGGYFGKGKDELIRPEHNWDLSSGEFKLIGSKMGKNDHTLKQHNEKMQSMRDRMLKDKIFKKVFEEERKRGGTSADFVKRYKAEWKREMEFSAGKEQVWVKNRALDSKKISLSQDEKEFFRNMYNDMWNFNNKEVRKGVNEDMMKALKNVNEKAAGDALTVEDMKLLNYTSAKYYMARKGTFMEPVTQAGKDRLQASADIHKKANGIIDGIEAKLANDKSAEYDKMMQENNPVTSRQQKKVSAPAK